MADNLWNIPQNTAARAPELEAAGYEPLLAAVLAARGVDSPEEAAEFLGRGISKLSDPFELEDMDRAVRRIELAVERGEKITVYGDYDVDGITASCLLYKYLKSRGAGCGIYIPDRLEEGYGLNSSAIEAMARDGTRLIVTVDCGITAIEETDLAHSLGMDVIITDHHRCLGELPKAEAVVDPQRSPEGAGAALAGVGVAFKLVCALDGDAERVLEMYSELVAVGTVADVMPMTGENRVLVSRGMEKLDRRPGPGLAALIREAGAEGKPLSVSLIGYTLAPRINAAGRLCQTEKAVELLLCEDRDSAEDCAAELCALNRKRQELESLVCREAAEAFSGAGEGRPVVLAGENWHSGVVGIAASRLAEEFKAPAVMICLDGDIGKGSCRSWGDFNLFEGLSACSEYLEGFGGHSFAAGLNIRRENIDAFRQAFEKYYSEHMPEDISEVSAELLLDSFEMLTMEGVESLELLEPCGSGNPRPVICVRDAVMESVSPIGGGKHLRLRFRKAGRGLDAVFFAKTLDELDVREGRLADLCFCPQINEFRGRRSVQLVVSAVRPSGTEEMCRDIVRLGTVPESGIRLDRPVLESVWRFLRRSGASHRLSLTHIIDGEERVCTEPVKLCLCLKIFEELALLKVGLSGETLHIEFINKGSRVSLESSALFRKLSGADTFS